MKKPEHEVSITPDTVLLDIVSRWPETVNVIRRHDDKAGVCLCCSCLFDTLEAIAGKYSLNLAGIMREINDAVAGKSQVNET